MMNQIFFEESNMKRILLLTVCLSLFLGGTAFAQSADEVYIKAMQAKDAAEKTKLLKEYVSLYAGKGNKYDNYAYAYLCLLQYQAGQNTADTIGLAEKAIAAGGLDDLMKGSLLFAIADINLKSNQFDKAKAAAQQVIQHANAAKVKEAEAANAKTWNLTIGRAHYLTAQALEKSGDINGALEAYNQAYTVTKDGAVLVRSQERSAKGIYDSGKFVQAEPVFRYLAGTGKDQESLTILAQILRQAGQAGRSHADVQGHVRQEQDRGHGLQHRDHAGQRSQDQPGLDRRCRQLPPRRQLPRPQAVEAVPGHRPDRSSSNRTRNGTAGSSWPKKARP